MGQLHKRIPAEIHSDMLDTIGRTFRFKHPKGIAEWLKNSLDQSLRLHNEGKEPRDGNWPLYICLVDGEAKKSGPNLAVVDFGGTTHEKVKDFFLKWGYRGAATHGATSAASVTGGHGNGGKFYMREMWKDGARLLTWRDGKCSSLVVDKAKDGTTGYWEIEDAPMSWREALAEALTETDNLGGSGYLLDYMEQNDAALIQELDAGKRGLTVVAGRRASQMQSSNDVVTANRWNAQKLVDEIRDAPQARRPIQEMVISIFRNGALALDRLRPPTITPDPEWQIEDIPLPLDLLVDDDLRQGAQSVGTLRLMKADSLLTGNLKEYNAVFVTDGKDNPIASYAMLNELPIPGHTTMLGFLYGELQLTFPKVDELLENDRERLIKRATTTAILNWVGEQLWERIKVLEDAQRAEKKKSNLEIAALLNDALNKHAKNFLHELQTMIMVDVIQDDQGGGPGKSGTGSGGRGGAGGGGDKKDGVGGGEGEGGSTEVPGSMEERKKTKFPQVLLSSFDEDPANPGQTKNFTDRHPPLYQDETDKAMNVWWINTSHTFAQLALDPKYGGPTGHAFRSHQLFMFRDVVQIEALRWVKEAELRMDVIENKFTDVSDKFLGNLPTDLVGELLD